MPYLLGKPIFVLFAKSKVNVISIGAFGKRNLVRNRFRARNHHFYLNSLSSHIIFQFRYRIGCQRNIGSLLIKAQFARKSHRTSPSFSENFIGILPKYSSIRSKSSSHPVHCSMSRRHNCLFQSPSIMSPPDRFGKHRPSNSPTKYCVPGPPAGAPGLTFTINTHFVSSAILYL